MMYNAAERKDVRKLEKAASLASAQSREIVKGIMSVAAGRHWMHERLERCHIFTTSFSTDAIAMAFAEGERNIGLQLLSDVMEACPDKFQLMMQEENERRISRNRPASSSDPDGGDSGAVEDFYGARFNPEGVY